MLLRIVLLSASLGATALNAQNLRERVIFDFQGAQAASGWQTVNDGVMGGRSAGRFRIVDGEKLQFFGNLSLANNGGFASVRSRRGRLGLVDGETIVIRVKGDGRTYSLNLYVPTQQTAFSFRAPFQTRASQWVDIAIPIDRFVATSFGRVVPNRRLDPGLVDGIGILLGDKRSGPFQLEVDWIRVRRSEP